jgi:hypothetical protein
MIDIPLASDPDDNTWDTVDGKLAEAEFFLRMMAHEAADTFEFGCHLSAYLSAARTATLAMQHFEHVPGCTDWYQTQQAKLKSNALAKFMLEARNEHVHGGPYPIASGEFKNGQRAYRFAKLKAKQKPPSTDILTACRDHFVTLLEIALDAYTHLGVHIDPQQHFTKEHFETLGRTIDDAEVELWGWVRGPIDDGPDEEEGLKEEEGLEKDEGAEDDGRWHELRGHVGECQINHLFYSYLGKTTPPPKEPEHYADFAFTPDDKGWVVVPAGFSSRAEYWKRYPARKPPDDCGDADGADRKERQESPARPLRPLFNQWSDPLVGPLLIRLTVLYEDLRLEHRATLAYDLGTVDVNAARYRRFYFQRRIYATLHEIHGALHQLNCSEEFCRYLQEGSTTRWRTWSAAVEFFNEHGDVVKRRRNLFGAHFGNKAALQARDNMSDGVVGQMACLVDHDRALLDPSHLFAQELAALVFYWGVEAARSKDFSKEAEQFIQTAMVHAGNAFLAISARHFLPYFGWNVGPAD